MPQSEGPPVIRVVLDCGHVRRHFDKEQKLEYFCLDCDDFSPVKEQLIDPRQYQGARYGPKVPDRSKYKR